MERNTIWMLFLTFGILSSFFSCKNGDTENSYFEECKYNNNSNYLIELVGYYNDNEYSYELEFGEVLSQKQELVFGKIDSIIINMDSIKVIFNNEKSSIFYKNIFDSDFNILDRNNYTITQINDNEKLYSYSFTDDDYNNAE